MDNDLYIGLMSGTSMDGIDAVIVDFSEESRPKLIASHHHAIPTDLKQALINLCHPGENGVDRLGTADTKLGKLFAESCNELLKEADIEKSEIQAIGSHGQTIRHKPDGPNAYTIQIGDPNIIAAETGITTIADFRRRDLALGGQAAPLAPAFHHYLFSNRADENEPWVLNIGGIANLTQLSKTVIGFDTGPGNTLLDAWAGKHLNKPYDKNGEWAASGKTNETLLQLLLDDDYFKKPIPKSTGREYFHLDWLTRKIEQLNIKIAPQDIQATLAELTAGSIANALTTQSSPAELYICGGGIHNTHLINRIKNRCLNITIKSTQEIGIDPDLMEAMAFAWLAKQTLEKKPGNLPSVTGAKNASILGGIYPA